MNEVGFSVGPRSVGALDAAAPFAKASRPRERVPTEDSGERGWISKFEEGRGLITARKDCFA